MKDHNKNKRYFPHEIATKQHSVETYRQTKDISYVCRKYKISKASLLRWNKKYDGGTKASLENRSHRPHSPHPNVHTKEEITWIENYHRRNPNIPICELFGKFVSEKDYQQHPGSLYRVFIRLGYRKQPESTKEKRRKLKPYDTPKDMG